MNIHRALTRFQSEGFHLGELLAAAKQDGVLVETHWHLCPCCQDEFHCDCDCGEVPVFCQDCYRVAEEAAGISDSEDEPKTIRCPYCGQSGDEAWFKSHDHGPNPFGDDKEAA